MTQRWYRNPLALLGMAFCLGAIILNPYTAAPMLLGDIAAESPPVRSALWILDAVLVLWGALTIVLRHKKLIELLNLTVVSCLIFGPLCAEFALRVAIALDIKAVRNPRLYGDWFNDDEHWQLWHLWSGAKSPTDSPHYGPDPLLGWAPPRTKENPYGVYTTSPYEKETGPAPVLCYGCSFMTGSHTTEYHKKTIPRFLRSLLPDRKVFDFAVRGYGLDQIYLRFRESHSEFESPTIVLGIMTSNLDRDILSVRDAPKPYFTLDKDGELELHGVPLPADPEDWYRGNPPRIRSYFTTLLLHKIDGLDDEIEKGYGQERKRRLGRKILEAIVQEARDHDLNVLAIIFYMKAEFFHTGWRERFLKAELTRLGVPFVDSKSVLLRKNSDPRDWYLLPPEGHLNGPANEAIAKALFHALKDDPLLVSYQSIGHDGWTLGTDPGVIHLMSRTDTRLTRRLRIGYHLNNESMPITVKILDDSSQQPIRSLEFHEAGWQSIKIELEPHETRTITVIPDKDFPAPGKDHRRLGVNLTLSEP